MYFYLKICGTEPSWFQIYKKIYTYSKAYLFYSKAGYYNGVAELRKSMNIVIKLIFQFLQNKLSNTWRILQ